MFASTFLFMSYNQHYISRDQAVTATSCSTLLFLTAQTEMRAFTSEDVAQNCTIISMFYFMAEIFNTEIPDHCS